MIKYIKIYDLIGFKICWALCAFCTIWEMPYLGPLATLLFIIIHLYIVSFNNRDIKVICLAILCGLLMDSFFSYFSFIDYKGGVLADLSLAPLWILSMWAGFSVTMLYTLDSIRNKYFYASLIGFFGGPLSYNAGVQIGSLTITSNLSYFLLAIGWGLIIPFLFMVINKLKK